MYVLLNLVSGKMINSIFDSVEFEYYYKYYYKDILHEV